MTRLEELPDRIDRLTTEMSQFRTEVRAEFHTVRGEISSLATQMRVLHEDVIGRIALMREGGRRPRRKP